MEHQILHESAGSLFFHTASSLPILFSCQRAPLHTVKGFFYARLRHPLPQLPSLHNGFLFDNRFPPHPSLPHRGSEFPHHFLRPAARSHPITFHISLANAPIPPCFPLLPPRGTKRPVKPEQPPPLRSAPPPRLCPTAPACRSNRQPLAP